MSHRLWVIGFAALMLINCGHQAPQRPSQRKGEAPKADSAAMALLELNQQLAITADKQLRQYVHAQKETYALYDAHTWLTILERGDVNGETPVYDAEWIIHMRIYNLEGRMLEDHERSFRIGKNELPLAVDANIRELHHGSKARLVAPWYSAFGRLGTANIPPYENVIIEIELK